MKNKKIKKYSFLGFFFFLCITILVLIVKGDFYYTKNYRNSSNTTYTTIYQQKTLHQVFFSSVDELDSISLKFGTFQKELKDKTVHLTIESEEGKTLGESEIPIEDIQDNEYTQFAFSKIENSKGKKLTFTVECEKCSESEQLAIYGRESSVVEEYVIVDGDTYQYQTTMILTGTTTFCSGIMICTILLFTLSFYYFYKNTDKFKKIISKNKSLFQKNLFFFSIDFALTLGVILLVYRMICKIEYSFCFPWLNFLVMVLLAEIVLFLCAFKVHIKKIKIEEFFLLLAIPIGLSYLVFLIPGQVADENIHYTSAYKLGKGEWKDTGNYVEIPYQIRYNDSIQLQSYYKLNTLLVEPPTDEVALSTASGYSATVYLPATLGILIGRCLNLPYFIGFYLARILTFICTLILGYYAIRFLPIGKMLLCVYLLNPMFIHQGISISADALMNAFSILYISYVLYLLKKDSEITKKNKIILTVLMLLIATIKYVYIPLVLLSLLLVFKKDKQLSPKEKKEIVLSTGLAIALCVILYILHSMIPVQVTSGWIADKTVSLTAQLSNLLHHPLLILKVFVNTIKYNGNFYWESFFGGYLGWLNIIITRFIINIYVILLMFSPFLTKEKENLNGIEKIGMGFVFSIIFLLVIYGMYLTWTAVGEDIVVGVQGRYFLPIVILPLLILCDKDRHLKFKYPLLLCSTILIFVHCYIIQTIIACFL